MKKHLTSTIFGSLLIFSSFAGKAQTVASTGKTEPALIRYLGTQDDMFLFNISYPNPEGLDFSVALKDQDGAELYKHTFHGKNFHKQFRLPKSDKSRLSFLIGNGKETAVVKTFEINVYSRNVQDIAVKKPD